MNRNTAILAGAGDDLSAAEAQNEAMGRAKGSLRSAVEKAESGNAGYRAVSIVPALKSGRPVGKVVLENAMGTTAVSENLN